MKKKKKRGFTLVELLAVIVVLAIILVIAVPKILDVIKNSRENSIISSVKLIARNTEQKILTNEALGEDIDTLNCDDIADINTTDYKSCTINVNNETKEVTVTIEGQGKFNGYTCSGNKNNVTCGTSVCKHMISEYYIPEDRIDKCIAFGSTFNASAANDLCTTGGTEWYEWGYMSVQEFVELAVSNGLATLEELLINGDNGFVAEKEVCSENYLSLDWKIKMDIDDDKLKSITFKKSMSEYNKINGIDVSQSQDGGILMYLNSNGNYYDIDIVSDEVIYFPPNSGMLFGVDWSNFPNLESIKFNGAIDTSKVTNMKNMFLYCESLVELDLSSFDTSNVTNMHSMFNGCGSLEHIYVGNKWSTDGVENSSLMFSNCGNLPNFDSSKTDKTYAYVGGYLESKN